MAILNRGFDQVNLRGSVGAVTYRRVGGVTIASQKVPMNSNARRSVALMLQRMQWPNLVALWRIFGGLDWHPSFIRENRRVSDFNAFMAANIGFNQVYLKRSMVQAGAAVVVPVTVTRGELPSIFLEAGTGGYESDIAMGAATIGSTTTVAAFSQAILDNNSGWRAGDQFSFVILFQSVDADMVPRVRGVAYEVTLSRTDSRLLSELGVGYSALTVSDGYLALTAPGDTAAAIVHSRRDADGTTIVSSQSLVTNSTVAATYQSEQAFLDASESYGGLARDQFLTPNVTTIVAPQP